MHAGKSRRGRLLKWVEKSSIEKISWLLEISEWESHYRVLLTRENVYAVRHNPNPYTLPVIPWPLPSNIVEGEHFVLKDVRRLASGNASSSRDLVVGALSRVQGARSASSATSGRGSDLPPASDRGTRGQHPERLLTLAPVVKAAPRVVKVKRKRALQRRDAPESQCENFVPWVLDDSEGPQDLEEEERMERSEGLLDRYATRKRKRQVSSSEESGVLLLPRPQSRAHRFLIVCPLLMGARGSWPSLSLAPPSWNRRVSQGWMVPSNQSRLLMTQPR